MIKTAKILFFVSFSFTLFLAYLVSDGIFYPFGAGTFLAGLYLTLVGLIFFFSEVPKMRRRLLEAVAIILLFASFHLFPPLSLTAIPALFFILLMPIYLGWKHRVFIDVVHIVLWLIASSALGSALYWPMPKAFWSQVLTAGASSLAAHYFLLKAYPRIKKTRGI